MTFPGSKWTSLRCGRHRYPRIPTPIVPIDEPVSPLSKDVLLIEWPLALLPGVMFLSKPTFSSQTAFLCSNSCVDDKEPERGSHTHACTRDNLVCKLFVSKWPQRADSSPFGAIRSGAFGRPSGGQIYFITFERNRPDRAKNPQSPNPRSLRNMIYEPVTIWD